MFNGDRLVGCGLIGLILTLAGCTASFSASPNNYSIGPIIGPAAYEAGDSISSSLGASDTLGQVLFTGGSTAVASAKSKDTGLASAAPLHPLIMGKPARR